LRETNKQLTVGSGRSLIDTRLTIIALRRPDNETSNRGAINHGEMTPAAAAAAAAAVDDTAARYVVLAHSMDKCELRETRFTI